MRIRPTGIFVAGWALVVVGGTWSLALYASRPGPVIHPKSVWPVADRIRHSTGVNTLVMAVHPNCPCSRASVDELEIIMSRCGGRLNAVVLFAQTPGLIEDPLASDLWKSASRIPGVICQRDPGGALSASFGAKTSGQVFLYDPAGALRFSGGITASRSHEGDNAGVDAITSIVAGQDSTVKQTPVFGCSIR